MKKKKRLLFLLIIFVGLIPKLTLAETFEGEYSIDYLLRNYNVVTLGQKDTDMYQKLKNAYNIEFYYADPLPNINKGDIQNFSNITGAVLINGDYKSANPSVFGVEAGNVKSFIKGNKGGNVSTPSQLVTDPNYIDFEKMYTQVMLESEKLADSSEFYINSSKVEIAKPGIYTINDMATSYDNEPFSRAHTSGANKNVILIKKYDRNSIYVLNYYNEYINYIPDIVLQESGSSNSINLIDYIETGQYNGNIIINFPNAKYIYNNNGLIGENIIAPQATLVINNTFRHQSDNGITYIENCAYGNFIVNTIFNPHQYINNNYNIHSDTIVGTNYKLTDKIIENKSNYYEETTDYTDDEYSRNYSISDLLQNYNLVTLEHKAIDSKSKILQYGNTPGSVKLFHITGQALIAGDLISKVYENVDDELYSSSTNNINVKIQKMDRTMFDLESNKVTESYIKGKARINSNRIVEKKYDNTVETYISIIPTAVIQPWDNMSYDNNYYYNRKNSLITQSDNYSSGFTGDGNFSFYMNNYINFDRLYNNIVAEQSAIDEGKKVNTSDVTHIQIGGNYVIDDINEINEIVFDNFADEKDNLTIITIKNSGDINFPLISKDTGSYKGIVTNDYYGKEQATHFYEQDTFVQDSYHGNIIWNVPNATYIKLKENAPFAGHLIAPNADVETPETHFAGCFIVNSIYGEGNTEAHFYPITANLKCNCEGYNNLSEDMKAEFSKFRLKKLLGADKTIIEKTIKGDQARYEEDQVTLEKVYNQCPANNISAVELLTNPKTYKNLGIIILLLGSIISYIIFNKKETNKE